MITATVLLVNPIATSVKGSPKFDTESWLLIIAIATISLLVIRYIFAKKRIGQLLRLWYFSVVYGPYSNKFLAVFKDENIMSPYNSCIDDDILLHFVPFTKKNNNSLEFQTKTTIVFNGIDFSTSSKNLIKSKGEPDSISITTINDTKFMVVGYNEVVHDLKMKTMYFFLNDQFFMGEFLFSDHLSKEPSNLVKSYSSKYLNGIPVVNHVFYITDAEGNQLYYEHNGFALSIKYLYKGDESSNKIMTGLFPTEDKLAEYNLIVQRNLELLDRI